MVNGYDLWPTIRKWWPMTKSCGEWLWPETYKTIYIYLFIYAFIDLFFYLFYLVFGGGWLVGGGGVGSGVCVCVWVYVCV